MQGPIIGPYKCLNYFVKNNDRGPRILCFLMAKMPLICKDHRNCEMVSHPN
jgi:hypothetical protein